MNTPTGAVFSTYASSSVDQHWRMNRGTSHVGSVFARSGDNTFNLQAPLENLQFWTGDNARASLWYRVGTTVINSQPAFNQTGYFGLSGTQHFLLNFASPGPFSRMHLVDGSSSTTGTYAPTLGFRGWMKNGITFTGNTDQMYIGHKYLVDGSGAQVNTKSQAVVQWSEGSLDDDRQSLRFIFTTTPSAGTGAVATDGLEIMRLWPESNTSGFVGIGDFATASQSPTERLDLLDGNVRLRALPGTTATTDDRVVVVDANGVLRWRSAASIASTDCRWTMPTGGGAGTNHLSTAYSTATADCPDEDEAVGIGINLATSSPIAKMMVETSVYDTTVVVSVETVADRTTGISVYASGGAEVTKGINVDVEGGSDASVGIQSRASTDGYYTFGGLFVAEGTGLQNIGIHGRAYSGATHCMGVEGHSYGSGSVFNAGVSGVAVCDGNAINYLGVQGVVHPPSFAFNEGNLYGVYGNAPANEEDYLNSFGVYCDGRQFSTTSST
jgi:hypothetical protein